MTTTLLPAATLLERAAALRAHARSTLRGLLESARGQPFALVDFPAYANVGDAAIWVGTRHGLESLGAGRPAYTCDRRTYDRASLARRVGEGTIFLLGGGNFGDLYPEHQRLRESILADFPRHRVVQLPQTIHFRSRAALEASGRLLRAHRDFVLLVRDEASLALAQEELGVSARLCPDFALLLEPAAPAVAPEGPVLWLARGDDARLHAPPARLPPDVVVSDWPVDPTTARRRWARLLRRLLRHGVRGPVRGALSRCYDPIARRRLAQGLGALAGLSALVTDRLHGHLLALLLGIPHVLLDDRTGKVRAFHEAWTRGLAGVAFAPDVASVPACLVSVREAAGLGRA